MANSYVPDNKDDKNRQENDPQQLRQITEEDNKAMEESTNKPNHHREDDEVKVDDLNKRGLNEQGKTRGVNDYTGAADAGAQGSDNSARPE